MEQLAASTDFLGFDSEADMVEKLTASVPNDYTCIAPGAGKYPVINMKKSIQLH